MIDKLKQHALQKGMKLLSNPKIMKVMADPRFMNALMRGIEVKGKLESDLEEGLRKLATRLNLVTKSELNDLQQSVQNIETRLDSQVDENLDGPKGQAGQSAG